LNSLDINKILNKKIRKSRIIKNRIKISHYLPENNILGYLPAYLNEFTEFEPPFCKIKVDFNPV